MSKPGNYTAYQQYKPIDNGTIEAIQHWSSFAEQKRQNDINNRQQDKQLENQAEKEKQQQIEKWLSYDSIPLTGVENVDMAHAKIMAADRVEIEKIVNQLVNEDRFSEKGISLQMQLDKIKKNPAVIKGMVSAPLELAKEYINGVGTKYEKTPQNDNFFANLKNAKFTRNENSDPAFIIKDPKDNTKEIVLTEAEILNLEQVYPLIPKFNYDNFVKDNAEILNKKPPSTTEQDPKTGYLITNEGYDEPSVQQIAKSLFIDGQGNPTQYANSFLAQKGIYNYDPKAEPKIPIGIAENPTVGPENEKPKTKLDELVEQFITDITPRLVDKKSLKTNTNNIQQQKANTDAAYKAAKISQGQQAINLKATIAEGEGKIKTPVTLTDFKQLPKPDGKGRIGFNVVDNALIISYGPKGNEVERKVTGIWVNPNDKKDLKINYIESGKKANALGTSTPYSTPKTFDSKTDGEMAGTFSAELGQTIEELSTSLINKAKPANKAKPKETLEERKKRLLLK